MELLVVRHARAQERGVARDADRTLTRDGIRRAHRAFQGLARIAEPPDLVLTSPLPRAAQTAELLARACDEQPAVRELEALRPGGSWRGVLRALKAESSASRVAIVGHEPDLGRLVSRLVAGRPSGGFPLAKAGACLVRFEESPAEGDGALLWSLRPAQLLLLRR